VLHHGSLGSIERRARDVFFLKAGDAIRVTWRVHRPSGEPRATESGFARAARVARRDDGQDAIVSGYHRSVLKKSIIVMVEIPRLLWYDDGVSFPHHADPMRQVALGRGWRESGSGCRSRDAL
jgi:hypothetical protein